MPRQYVGKKELPKTQQKPSILLRQWLRRTSAFCKGLFVFSWLRILALPKLYRLLITHLNRWNRGQWFSRWSPCLGFCVPVNGRIHYPTLEKPGAQNIATCENQSNTNLVITENQLKRTFWKKTQKRQEDWQVLTKDFISYIIRYKSSILWVQTPENGQNHSNNSSATADELFECVWPSCGVCV